MGISAPWDSSEPAPTAEPVTTPAVPSPSEPSQADKDRGIMSKGLQPAYDRAAMSRSLKPAQKDETKDTAPVPPAPRVKDSAPKPTHPYFKPIRDLFKGTAK